MRLKLLALLALMASLLSGCGYNQIQTLDEAPPGSVMVEVLEDGLA